MAGLRPMDEVRGVMRRLRYSIHTERSDCDWIAQFVRFQKMLSREDLLAAGAPRSKPSRAISRKNGTLRLPRKTKRSTPWCSSTSRVLDHPLEGRIDAARATKEPKILWTTCRRHTADRARLGVTARVA